MVALLGRRRRARSERLRGVGLSGLGDRRGLLLRVLGRGVGGALVVATVDDQHDHDDDRGGPEQSVEPLEPCEVPPRRPAGAPAQADDGRRGRPEHRDVEVAADRLLQVDAAVPGLGEKGPSDAVQDEAGSREEDRDDEETTHDEGVDPEPVGDPAGDATDPAVVRAGDAETSDGVEEAVHPGGLGRRVRGRTVGTRGRRTVRRVGRPGGLLGRPGRCGAPGRGFWGGVLGVHGSSLPRTSAGRYRVFP
ncbi:hypothetical protein D3C74_329260 [compost metagenome]